MKISADAIIPAEKLTRYLLAPRVRDDKSRYLARGGFHLNNPEDMEAAIRKAVAGAEATVDRVNQHGTFYNVRCELSGPAGTGLPVRLVWLRRLDDKFSLVTLIPDL